MAVWRPDLHSAATGGAVALRVVGGSTVDAVGWGDAANAFVEGAPAPAPAASSTWSDCLVGRRATESTPT